MLPQNRISWKVRNAPRLIMHPALLGPSEASTLNDFVEVLVQKYFTQSLYFEMVKFQEVGQLKRPNQTCFKHFKKETQHFFH